MRTSVPGISDRRRGFTLLEVLVVLAILTIVVGAVTVSLAPAESRRVDEEGARLAALFRLAQDESRVRSREIVWRADRHGYRFDIAGVAGQRSSDDPLRPRAWPFPIEAVTPGEVRFGREPLLTAVDIRIATPGRTLTLAVDAMGEATVKP
jgi:type II secretion system protein H